MISRGNFTGLIRSGITGQIVARYIHDPVGMYNWEFLLTNKDEPKFVNKTWEEEITRSITFED